MATLFPTAVAPDLLGSPGGSPFGPASVQFGFEVPEGSPGELEALGNGMRNAGGWFGDQLASVRTSGRLALEAGGGWGGQASSAFSELSGHLIQTLSGNQFAADQAAMALGQLSKALSHAQQVTRQALADCVRLHGEMVTQQGAANDAATKASSFEQDASNPLQHPAAVVELNHQATLARGQQKTAQDAANLAETDLKQAERRGQDAYHAYQTEAQGLASRIQDAAGDLRPVDQMAGRAAASLLGYPGGTSASGIAVMPAVIGNPFTTSPFDIYEPGSLLSAIEESRYRDYVLDAVDGSVSGGAAFADQRAYLLRRQLTENADRIVQYDTDVEEYAPGTAEGSLVKALSVAVSSENDSLSASAGAWSSRAGFLESSVAPTLLGVNFALNLASGQSVPRAAVTTGFSFAGAWTGVQAFGAACPEGGPIVDAACAGAGGLIGGVLGQAAANEVATKGRQEIRSAWKTLSTPVGGGGLLSGVTPLMGVNPG